MTIDVAAFAKKAGLKPGDSSKLENLHSQLSDARKGDKQPDGDEKGKT